MPPDTLTALIAARDELAAQLRFFANLDGPFDPPQDTEPYEYAQYVHAALDVIARNILVAGGEVVRLATVLVQSDHVASDAMPGAPVGTVGR